MITASFNSEYLHTCLLGQLFYCSMITQTLCLLNEKQRCDIFCQVKIFVVLSNNIFDQDLIKRSDCFDMRHLA